VVLHRIRQTKPTLSAGARRAKAYLSTMAKSDSKFGALGMIAVIVPLFALLGAAAWFASRAWTEISGPPMPAAGYIAMTLGIVFSVVIGCGLMALLFYSSRHGYDEPGQRQDDHE
jgi:hypothetical protein